MIIRDFIGLPRGVEPHVGDDTTVKADGWGNYAAGNKLGLHGKASAEC